MQVKLLAHLPLYLAAHACRMSQNNHDKSDTVYAIVCDSCGNIDLGGDEGHLTFEMNIGDARDHECLKCGSMKNHWELTCGPKDAALIERVGNKLKHASILEQLVYTFDINGVSRALLQELARHRTARLTVKSSRYTLKELKDEETFNLNGINLDFNFDESCMDYFEWYAQKVVWDASKYIVLTYVPMVDLMSIKALENLRLVLMQGISNDKVKYCLPECYKTRLQWQIDGRNLQNFLRLRSDKSALWEIRDLANAIYNALPADHKYLYKDCMYGIVQEEQRIANEAYQKVLTAAQIDADQDQ